MAHENIVLIGRHIAYVPDKIREIPPGATHTCEASGTGTGTLPMEDAKVGTPIIVKLNSAVCAESPPDFMGFRHVGYDGGFSLVAYAFTCCDAYCADGDEDCYVEQECAGGVGISNTVYAYFADVNSCLSASGQKSKMEYNESKGAWYGGVTLRGGTLSMEFRCVGGSYKLSWWGCEPECDDPTSVGTSSESCSFTTAPECNDPLIVNFGQITLDDCCDCDSDHTNVEAEVQIVVVANCRKVVTARHVGYAAGDAGDPGVPIVAIEKDCQRHEHDAPDCTDLTCGVVMTVTGSGDCACMSGSAIAPYNDPGGNPTWQASIGSCDAQADYVMACTTNCNGTVTYHLVVTCGAANTGEGFVTIPAEDVENLDITFEIEMTDPTVGGCSGSCVYQWNEMTQTWQLVESSCTPPANCDECPNGPNDPSPGSVDGEFRSDPCPGGTEAPCCEGFISVRVMR